MVPRVDFFIIGVQKAGTTALAEMLRRHPSAEIARNKEAHHFNGAHTNWRHPDHRRLHDEFDWTRSGVVRGEATPAYVYWPQAIERLHAYNPDARLILALRHPSFRAYSHWRMERKRGRETLDFGDAVTVGRDRVDQAPRRAHLTFSYVERGFYAPQVRRLFGFFPREQILVYRVERLWAEPAAILARVEDHVRLPHHDWSGLRSVYTVPIAAPGPAMPSDVRAALDRLFHDDLVETAALTGLDLSHWLRPGYAEPMAAGGDGLVARA